MSQSSIAVELHQDGDKPRVYQFEQAELVLGNTPASQLSLETSEARGSEVAIRCKSNGVFLWHPTKPAPGWLLNGNALKSILPAKAGDVLTVGSIRVILKSLIWGGPREGGDTVAMHERGDVGHATPPFEEPLGNETRLLDPADLIDAPSEEPSLIATEEPCPANSPAAKNSHLYLFFAPVEALLKDDDVSEVMINGPKNIYVERKGKIVRVDCEFVSEQALQAAVMNVARSVGRFFNSQNPRLDARLPDGSRVHAVLSPIARAGTTVAIRKFSKEKLTLEKLISLGSISSEGARLLDAIVKLGKNLIVSGATSSGKTSVLNVLSSLIPSDSRILVLEDASELQLQQSHIVAFETRKPDEYGKGEVTIRHLLHSTLRLRPDRIVVGEVRGEEALDLIQAMNTGHDGSMSTIHASNPQGALSRLEVCALLGSVEVPQFALRQQVASAVQIVLQTERLADGSRKITSISELLGLEKGEYRLEPILVFEETGYEPAPKSRILGRHVFTGYRPSFLKAAAQRGVDWVSIFPGWR